MNRLAAAAIAALLTFGAASARADDTETRVSGTVLTAEVANDPFADNVSGAGSLVVADKAGRTESYSVLGTTRLTRDGKPIVFDSTLVGNMVVKAVYDPRTKLLTVLELKSAPPPISWTDSSKSTATKTAKPAAPGTFSGEVAFADAINGLLSVRSGKGRTQKFAVVDTTTVLRETADGPAQEVGFETVAVGDIVVVRSRDGKTADQIRVRPAAK
ncbi:MAG: hypothetical protein ACHQ2Z_10145 [Elusimicrobiota bacterium]